MNKKQRQILEKLSNITKEEALYLLANNKDSEYLKDSIFMFESFPEAIRNDIDVATLAVEKNGYNMRCLSKELQANKSLALKGAVSNFNTVDYISEELKNDKEVGILVVQGQGYQLKKLSVDLRNDKDVVLEALKKSCNALEYASLSLKDDEEIVLCAITNKDLNNHSLGFASNRIRNKKEMIALFYERKFPDVKELLSNTQSDREFILEFTKKFTSLLCYASTDIRNDKEIVIESIKKEQQHFSYASDTLKDDDDVALVAINENPYNLRNVSDRLKDNKEFVLYTLTKSYSPYKFISDRLQNDEDVIITAAKNSEFVLDDLPKKLKREIGNHDPFTYLTNRKMARILDEKIPNKPLATKIKKKI